MSARIALVTGASGYVGLHIVSQLLQLGWTVHASVKYLGNKEKLCALKKLDAQHPSKLKLFEAHLLERDSFLTAMQRCSTVFHVASPFLVPEKIRDPEEQLFRPAVEGTQNILESVDKTESVQRVILTSSNVAQMEDQTLLENHFNETSTIHHNAYQYSKVLAEKEAWRIARAQSRWDMVVICPGFVVGPTLTPVSESGNLYTINQLLSGHMLLGVPNLAFALVDVREVATAHVRAGEIQSAQGRYIVSGSQMTSMVEITRIFKGVHASPYCLPTWNIPNWILEFVCPPMGLSRHWIRSKVGITFRLDNSRSIKELGIQYRPVSESLADHYHCWAMYSTTVKDAVAK
ncbi:unnamed protein product, partial [Clonostachys rosea f. rosea IK726]